MPLASTANSGAAGGRFTRMAVTLGFFAFRTSSTTFEYVGKSTFGRMVAASFGGVPGGTSLVRIIRLSVVWTAGRW